MAKRGEPVLRIDWSDKQDIPTAFLIAELVSRSNAIVLVAMEPDDGAHSQIIHTVVQGDTLGVSCCADCASRHYEAFIDTDEEDATT